MFRLRLRRLLARLLVRVIQSPRVFVFRLLSNNRVHGNPVRFQPVQFTGSGKIIFEDKVTIGYFPSPMFFSTYAYFDARKPSAEIMIGSDTLINNNFSAIADSSSIKIGRRCLIGTNVEIIDSDFHAIKFEDRGAGKPIKAEPVCIGNDVFIGSNVKILKGVSIGDGSVIANGAIVSNDIPSRAIAGGNPAKVIKMIV
jgi:acetyltransferase-like isoleucine patch superfamily enzyme